jgi:hypothetical protein
MHKTLEPRHELRIRTDEPSSPLHKHVPVDKIRGIKIAEFEELAECLFVADEFLHTVKESKFVMIGRERKCRGNRFRECRDKGWRHGGSICLCWLCMMNLSPLSITKVSTPSQLP